MLSFWIAVLVDVGTLLLVMFNGTRLLASPVYRDQDEIHRINSKSTKGYSVVDTNDMDDEHDDVGFNKSMNLDNDVENALHKPLLSPRDG